MADKIILSKKAEAELVEKKSRFIGYCAIAHSEEDAQRFIDGIKKKHWDATHNVYAYQIGDHCEIQRSTDDGEPSGTAGRPILEVIQGEGITDAVVVVTRYFGGTLLGTGGLVRAYSKAAQLAIRAAGKARLTEASMLCLFMNYDLLGKVENYLLRENITIDHIEYQNNAAIFCLIEHHNLEYFCEKLKEMFPHGMDYSILEGTTWLSVPLESDYD